MDLVWEINYQSQRGTTWIRVVSGAESSWGFTADPTVAALACVAFAHRFWVQMLIDGEQRIRTLNILPDCSLPPFSQPGFTTGLRVSRLRASERPEQWPDVEVEFADGRRATDQSGLGFIEPIVRAGLVSGEGVYDLNLNGAEIRGIRLVHDEGAGTADDPRRRA